MAFDMQSAMADLEAADKAGDTAKAKDIFAVIKAHEGSVAAPSEPEKQPEPKSAMGELGHQLGLGARYTLEAAVSPVTGTMDAVTGFLKGSSEIANRAGINKGQTYNAPSAMGMFSKGLTELGFPEPETHKEKRTQTIAEVAPAVIGGGALVYMGGKAIKQSEAVKKLTDLFSGAGVKDAAAKAEAAVAKQAEKAMEATKQATMKAQLEAKQAEKAVADAAQERQRIQGILDKPKPPTQSLGETGKVTESSLRSVLEQGAARRSEQGNLDFQKVRTDAVALENSGKFVDTTAAVKPVKDLLEHVKDIPELHTKMANITKMLEGKTGKPLVLDAQGKPLVMDQQNKSFENLEIARRYLNDVGYGADLEGFGSIGRLAARNAAKELDKAMGEFVPSFKTYKDNWAKLSEPLNIQGTKLGKILFDAETKAGTEVISKTADAKIPEKLFSSKENIGLYTEALAGGKNASPAAKAEASKTVQKMALKYFEEVTSNKAPEIAKKFIEAPERRDVMEALPQVKQVISGRATGEMTKAQKLASVQKQEEAAAKLAAAKREQTAKLLKARKDLGEDMFRADAMASQSSDKARQKAVTMYTGVLDKARDAGAVSDKDYKAMLNVLDEIPTMQEKAAYMHQIARRAAWVIGGGVAALGVETGYKMVK